MNINIKKVSATILLSVFCLILGLSAFALSSAKKATTQSKEEQKLSIEIWTFFDMNTPDDYYVSYWQQLAKKYGYDITVKTYSTQQIKDKLKIAAAGRQLPDIYLVWGGTYPDYLFDAGLALPVQDYLDSSTLKFKESYIQPYKDGNNYIIPCLPEAYGVTYANTKLLTQLGLSIPTTWEELLEFVQDVNTYNQVHGTNYAAIELGNKDAWLGELLYDTIAYRLDSASYQALAGGTITSQVDQTFEKAASYIQTLKEMQAFPEDFMEMGETEAVSDFISDGALLFPHQSTIVYYLMKNMGQENLSVCPFPACSSQGNNQILDINHTLTPGLCISSNCQYPDEAASLCLEFAQYINQSNVTQYGYLNMTTTSYDLPKQLPTPVEQMRDLIYGAEETCAYLYALLPSDQANALRSTTRNLYSDHLDMKQFLSEAKKYYTLD